jgi:hypothetical protein
MSKQLGEQYQTLSQKVQVGLGQREKITYGNTLLVVTIQSIYTWTGNDLPFSFFNDLFSYAFVEEHLP